MKTVTKQEAVRGFDALGKLANAGETVVVTEGGEPWIKLVPALKAKGGKSAAAFRARLNRISSKPIAGVDEIFARVRRRAATLTLRIWSPFTSQTITPSRLCAIANAPAVK